MSADEQPQGLNGMDLIIDGEPIQKKFRIQTYIHLFGFAGVRAFVFHSPLDTSSLCAASRLAEDKTWLFELELLQCNRCSTFFT